MEARRVRRAALRLEYEGRDISADVAPHLVFARYVDQAHAKADELEVVLEDRDGRWSGAWCPKSGAKLTASIEVLDWRDRAPRVLMECGDFTINRLTLQGPHGALKMTGLSAFVNSSLRREARSRAWNDTTLERMAGDIAGEHKLGLVYEGREIKLKRQDQRGESDLAFITRVAEEYGFRVKSAEGSLVLVEAAKMDAQAPVLTLTKGQDDLLGYEISLEVGETFKGVNAQHWSSEEKRLVQKKFSPAGAPDNAQTLQVRQRAQDQAEAEIQAKAELRRRNERQRGGTLSLMGAPDLRAGGVVELKGFGAFGGRFGLDEVTHELNRAGVYVTTAKIKATLEY